MIKTGGEHVASIEAEEAVYAAATRIGADVAKVVAVGLPHERWGEAITAVVAPTHRRHGRRDRAARRAETAAGRLHGAQVGRRRRAAAHVHRHDPENVVRDPRSTHYGG